MLYLKHDVRLTEAQAVVVMLAVVQQVFGDQPCMLTSGIDGVHKVGSLHGVGLAFDFRTKNLSNMEKDKLVGELKRRLTADFDVLLESRGEENEHLHVEFDPKERGGRDA